MFEAQGTSIPGATQGTTTPGGSGRPWHLWLIGIIGGLWSLMGVVSFMLTQMNVEAVMSRFPPQQREYFESLPWWAVAFWTIGVFGGVIGCVLLLPCRVYRIAHLRTFARPGPTETANAGTSTHCAALRDRTHSMILPSVTYTGDKSEIAGRLGFSAAR
jgi:hypothetical protein